MLYYTSTKSHRNQSWGFQRGFQTDLLLFQRVSHLRIAELVDEPWRQGACGFFLHVLVSIFLLFFPSLHLVLLILIVSSISRSMLGALLVPSPVLSCCVQHGWNSQLLPTGLEDAPLYRFIQQPLENSSLVGWSQAVLTVSVLSAKPYTQLCKETWGSHLEWPLDQSRDSIEFASSFCPKLARSLLMEARTCAASCAPGHLSIFFELRVSPPWSGSCVKLSGHRTLCVSMPKVMEIHCLYPAGFFCCKWALRWALGRIGLISQTK